MSRLRELVREPALVIDFVETCVLIVVAFGLTLTVDQQTWIVAVVVAALGLAKAAMTRPFAPAAVTDLGRAVLMLGVSFGLAIDVDTVTLMVTALGTLTSLVVRQQVSPNLEPVQH